MLDEYLVLVKGNGRGNLALLPLPCKFSSGFVGKNRAL